MHRVAGRLYPLLFASLGLLHASCGNGDHVESMFVLPVLADCAAANCSGQGVCAEPSSASEPPCLCDNGYVGTHCEHCAPGFHRDAAQQCAPDRLCAEQAEDPCGAHGHCKDDLGVIACACSDGYEGPRCDLCASGFALGDDGSSECRAQRSPSSRPAADPCAKEGCSGRGECSAKGTAAQCGCEPGYGGAHCERCEQGYARTTEGKNRCVPAIVEAKCPQAGCSRCVQIGANDAFPKQADNCFSAASLKLDAMTVASAKTGGTTWACAPSTRDGMSEPHIALETGTTEATLKFDVPLVTLSFGSSGWDALDLDIVSDDGPVQSLTGAAHQNQKVALAFDRPIQVLRFRSRDNFSHTFAVGDIVYEPATCK